MLDVNAASDEECVCVLFRQLGLPSLLVFRFSIIEEALYRRSNAGSSGFSVNKVIDPPMDQCQIIVLLR